MFGIVSFKFPKDINAKTTTNAASLKIPLLKDHRLKQRRKLRLL